MMGQPYQGGRLVATPRWGWPGMMSGDNVYAYNDHGWAGGKGPPNVGKESSRPSNKGKAQGTNHSIRAREQVL